MKILILQKQKGVPLEDSILVKYSEQNLSLKLPCKFVISKILLGCEISGTQKLR